MEGAEKNIMNNPYLNASTAQSVASKIVVLLQYIKLLFFPYPLAADYSYNQIPYSGFGNPMVLLSVVIYAALIALTYLLVKKRNALGFALALYLANLVLISNFIVNIGAPMGERLVYHSSIGFVIIMAWLLVKASERLGKPSASMAALTAVLAIIVVCSGFETIQRNKDWNNDRTLFLCDVQTVPNSTLANNNAAASCMYYAKQTTDSAGRRAWFGKAIGYLDKAIAINPGYMSAYMNRGLCYFNSRFPELGLRDWDTVRVHAPGQANLSKYLFTAGNYFFTRGKRFEQSNMPDSAIVAFKKSIEASPEVPDGWYQLGSVCFANGHVEEAQRAVKKAFSLAPNNAEVRVLYERVVGAAAAR
jgi:tetratricopeptide (TPR) repeat protein